MTRLHEIGEDKIVQELILPRFPNICFSLGAPDDCAVLEMPPMNDHLIIQTVDPCPTPVVQTLFDNDLYHMGWLSVVINASDIAAMGGKPIAMQLLIDAPKKMKRQELESFLDGVVDAARTFEVNVNGGNIRDNSYFAAQGAMTGYVHKNRILKQSAACAGDTLFSIGNNGQFWISILDVLRDGMDEAINDLMVRNALINPTPKINEAALLVENQLSFCATDASDGLMSALYSLSVSSGVDIEVDLNKVYFEDAYLQKTALHQICPYVPYFAWGDWQLVCAVSNSKIDQFETIMRNNAVSYSYCGKVVKRGRGNVSFFNQGKQIVAPNLMSKKFVSDQIEYENWAELIKNTRFL